MNLIKLIRSDIIHYSKDQKGINKFFVILYYQGLIALIIYRILNCLFITSKNNKIFSLIYKLLFLFLYTPFKNISGMELHPESTIGKNFYIPHGNSIVISKRAKIGSDVTIHQNTTIGINYKTGEAPFIGDGVFIGTNCSITGGISIGDNSIIHSNSSVIHNFPENSTIGGVPAKLIRKVE